jgi:hypothetical protein
MNGCKSKNSRKMFLAPYLEWKINHRIVPSAEMAGFDVNSKIQSLLAFKWVALDATEDRDYEPGANQSTHKNS